MADYKLTNSINDYCLCEIKKKPSTDHINKNTTQLKIYHQIQVPDNLPGGKADGISVVEDGQLVDGGGEVRPVRSTVPGGISKNRMKPRSKKEGKEEKKKLSKECKKEIKIEQTKKKERGKKAYYLFSLLFLVFLFQA